MNQRVSSFSVAFFCCFLFSNSFSQIELTIEDESKSVLLIKSDVKDTFLINKELKMEKLKWQSKGYISCYFKTLMKSTSVIRLRLVKGNKYKWGNINFPKNLQHLSGFEIQENSKINPISIKNSISRVISHYENSGYPFVQVFFDSISIDNSLINCRLNILKNQFFVLDSIVVKGGCKISKNYLRKWLGIETDVPYNQELISNIDSKLRNLSFVNVIRESEVFFSSGKAELVLYLEDNNSNRFDGILGLNPDENSGKIEVIGELKVDLRNAFRKGEKIYLNWEKVKNNSQNFNVNFSYPFLFKTRIGFRTELNYFRQDTSFANLRGLLGLSYFINQAQELSVSGEVIESNSLANTNDLNSVPSINTISTVYFGIGYELNTLDYRLNPRKGWKMSLNLKSGNKTITKNPSIESLDYQDLIETTRQLKSEVSISYFLPLFKRNTTHFKLQSGNLLGDNVFLNELFQIGGSKTIRGFNQQSILTSSYYIFTTEYRYLFSRNSNLFGFFDFGFYETNSIDNYQRDTPFGFGLGINFQVNAGIFSISYGLGSQKDNPILIRNGKIHFGFVSLF